MEDIPGFFYDQQTNRYYRRPLASHLTSLVLREREAKAAMENSPFGNLTPKLRFKGEVKKLNIFDALAMRGEGRVVGPVQWQKEVTRHSLGRLRKSRSFKVTDGSGNDMRQCHWVTSLGDGSYVGAWSRRTARQPEFYKIRISNNSKNEHQINMRFIARIRELDHHLIMDVQYAELDRNNIFLMYIANSTILRDNVFEIVHCPVMEEEILYDESENSLPYNANFVGKYHLQGALRCCSWNKKRKLFMVGTERGALYRSLYSDFLLIPSFDVDAHCLEFTQNGNYVYCGHDNSLLSKIDTRTFRAKRLSEFSSVIANIAILSDEHKLIVNTFDDKLFLFDVRKNKVIHEYRGHVNFGRKLPVSISERSNLLCVGGHDNKIRFWSLATGEPVCSLESITVPPSTSFLHETPGKFYTYTFCNESIHCSEIL